MKTGSKDFADRPTCPGRFQGTQVADRGASPVPADARFHPVRVLSARIRVIRGLSIFLYAVGAVRGLEVQMDEHGAASCRLRDPAGPPRLAAVPPGRPGHPTRSLLRSDDWRFRHVCRGLWRDRIVVRGIRLE